MMDATVDEVMNLAERLDPDQQDVLIQRLRLKLAAQRQPTRAQLLAEVERLRDTPPQPENRLLGKYANSTAPAMSEEALHAELRGIATEWERELDEFYGDRP